MDPRYPMGPRGVPVDSQGMDLRDLKYQQTDFGDMDAQMQSQQSPMFYSTLPPQQSGMAAPNFRVLQPPQFRIPMHQQQFPPTLHPIPQNMGLPPLMYPYSSQFPSKNTLSPFPINQTTTPPTGPLSVVPSSNVIHNKSPFMMIPPHSIPSNTNIPQPNNFVPPTLVTPLQTQHTTITQPQQQNDIPLPQIPDGDPVLTTVYITSLPEGISDIWMKKILICCGNICRWKRLTNIRSEPLSNGFCIFQKIEDLAIALEVFNGSTDLNVEKNKGLEICSPVTKKAKGLKFKIDKSAEDALVEYMKTVVKEQFEKKVGTVVKEVEKVLSELDEAARNGTYKAADQLLSSTIFAPEMANLKQLMATSWESLETVSEELSAERKELIMQEIIAFRQKAAKHLTESIKEIEEISESKYTPESQKHHESKKRHEFIPHDHIRHYDPKNEIDEEQIRAKRKKREQEQYQCYLERLTRWNKDEESRIDFIRHIAKREIDEYRYLKSRCESLQESLDKWNTDQSYPVLFDRLEYWSKCYKKRLPYIHQDEREFFDKGNSHARRSSTHQKTDKQNASDKSPSVHDNYVNSTGSVPEEERNVALKELKIPNDKDGLMAWDVKWDYLDDLIIENIITPFVTEKITEFIGSSDAKDLIQYAIELVKNCASLDKIITDLQSIFDDDAEEFAVSLFSIIVHETETKSLNHKHEYD